MSRNIFILGAGASREVGAPLMHDFLDVASDLARLGRVPNAKEEFDLVAEGRSALQQTHSKSTAIDLYNMEAVFSAFEMAKMLGGLGSVAPEKVNRFPDAYRKVISETLEQTINFKVRNNAIYPGVYLNLVELILHINKETSSNTSILSFNYDIALDYACHYRGLPIDYCLEDTADRNAMKVLKLHGSLNWTDCKKCKKIVAWKMNDYFNKYTWNLDRTKSVQLNISNQLSNFAHCGIGHIPSYPYIVPPTWNKSEHHHAIENVWKHAAKELAQAENIFVIGYSLPETDTFFHYLYSLGVMSDQIIRRFWVIDPCPKVEEKYRKILGNGVESKFKFINQPFSTGIGIIKDEF